MNRRLFAVVAALLVSGLLPLAAAAGVCVAKPCCHTSHTARIAASSPRCCSTNAESAAAQSPATNAKTSTAQPHAIASAVITPHLAAAAARTEMPSRVDTGPPSTRQRLATLSILLI